MIEKFTYSKSGKQLADEIDSNGYACIDNVIPQPFIDEVKASVVDLAKEHGSTFSIVGHDNLKDTLLGELYNEPAFCSLLEDIVTSKLGREVTAGRDKYQVLRVLNGYDLNSQSHLFHFDNYTLTVLLPLVIPDSKEGNNGSLFLLPNIRKLSKSPLKNTIIKILFQNPLVRKLLSFNFFRTLLGFKELNLIPNNLYFFWGFCSYHGNGNCDEGKLRSTALYHYHKTVTEKSVFDQFIKTKERSRVAK